MRQLHFCRAVFWGPLSLPGSFGAAFGRRPNQAIPDAAFVKWKFCKLARSKVRLPRCGEPSQILCDRRAPCGWMLSNKQDVTLQADELHLIVGRPEFMTHGHAVRHLSKTIDAGIQCAAAAFADCSDAISGLEKRIAVALPVPFSCE